MIQALLYLQAVSVWNRLLSQARRLRRPKYLAGFLVGGAYFFFYIIQPFFLGSARRGLKPSTESLGGFPADLETIAAAILLIIVLCAWILPQARAALAFTEAEATYLFAAPVRRRTLIHFKLIRSQAGILFTTLLMAFLTNRLNRSGGAWIHLMGWWLVLSTLNLHFIGVSFARARLLDFGISHWRRRLVILAFVALSALAAWWVLKQSADVAVPENAQELKGWIRQVVELVEAQPLATIMAPFRWLVRPYFSTSPAEFLAAAWPAALLLGFHYLWVIRSDVAFEEASLDLARRRAERLAAMRREPGKSVSGKARRSPFFLKSTGSPAVALLWKNLIGAGSIFNSRYVLIFALVLGGSAVMMGMNMRNRDLPVFACALLFMLFIWSMLLGPQILRQDFRQDLHSADLLKTYPMHGWQIVLGELLTPAVILSVIQWLMLVTLVLLFSRAPGAGPIALTDRLAVAIGAAILCPCVNLISLLIPNAAVLLFPGWLHSGPGGAQGIEATGQRLIFFLGQLLVFAVAVLPATVASLGVYFLLTHWLGWQWVVPVSAMTGAVILLMEAALGVFLLGKLFAKLDVAAEVRS